MLDRLEVNTTNSTPELVGHYAVDIALQTADIPRFVSRALADWDKNNIVGSLSGCILYPGGAQWSNVEFRASENDLLEVIVTFNGSYDSTEDGEETQLYGVRLSYSGIFRVNGDLDDNAKESCVDVVNKLMRNALFQLMCLSGFTTQMFSNVWAY